MKQIKIKRLVYTDGEGSSMIGAQEFNGSLSNSNILGMVHELGKTQWIGNSLWTIRAGIPEYHITVEVFYQYQKRWYELVLDAVRRI